MQIVVESMRAVEAARAAGLEGCFEWYTLTPMVVERLTEAGANVRWFDGLLEAGVSDAIGIAAYGVVDKLTPHLRRLRDTGGIVAAEKFAAMPLQRIITTLLYKQALLSALAGRHGPAIVVVGDTNLTMTGALELDRFDTLFSVLASRDATAWQLIHCEKPARKLLRSTHNELPFPQRVLSLINFSPGNISHRLLHFSRKSIGIERHGTVHILRENDLIREMLPWFFIKGIKIQYEAPLQHDSNAQESPSGLPGVDVLSDTMDQSLREQGLRIPTMPSATVVADLLHEASLQWQASAEAAQQRIDSWLSDGRVHILLSNTLSSPGQYALAELGNECGVPVVIADHNTTIGLSRFHEPMIPYSEAAHSDIYLTSSMNTTRFYEGHTASAGRSCTVGIAKSIRERGRHYIQRFLIRRFLRAGNERVVLYLTRACQNNLRALPYSQEDSEIHELEKTMVREVMPEVRGVPVIKFYNTKRHLDPSPFIEELRGHPRIITLQAGDFRYLRVGVDAIIVQSPFSTLGWAMGSNVPVFYLEEPQLGIVPELRDLFAASVFHFSSNEPGWTRRLLDTINRDDDEIRDEWNAMAQNRQTFLDECIFGPSHAGRNAVQVILESMKAGVSKRSTTNSRVTPQ